MIQKLPADIEDAIKSKVASGAYPDEVTVLREALASLDEFDEDTTALQEAIDRWKSGDEGMPLADAFEKVRLERANPS